MSINVIVAPIPSNTEVTPFRWVGLMMKMAIMLRKCNFAFPP